MDITFETKTSIRSLIYTWLFLSGVTLFALVIIHLAVYFLFYAKSITLVEHFSGIWITYYFYALVWPGVIANNYKTKTINVSHNGEVDAEKIKNYFLSYQYILKEQDEGCLRFEATKRTDRFFAGSKYITIWVNENHVSIELPAHKVYDVHHGFKFSKIFTS